MTRRYLLDTNTVSYAIGNRLPHVGARYAQELTQGAIVISAMVRAEMRYGQARLAEADPRHARIEEALKFLPVLAWDQAAADVYGNLKVALYGAGRPIGELDMQIAAHALATGLTLVTHNTKHFEGIAKLKLQDWMA